MLAEFNGYTMEAAPTFPVVDQKKGNRFFYFLPLGLECDGTKVHVGLCWEFLQSPRLLQDGKTRFRKRWVFERCYWHWMPLGRWHPGSTRPMFCPSVSVLSPRLAGGWVGSSGLRTHCCKNGH